MKTQYQGKEVDAQEIDVILSKEQWNEYQLSDGKVLMLKTVLISILRVEGATNPDGSPIYQFQTHLVPRIK